MQSVRNAYVHVVVHAYVHALVKRYRFMRTYNHTCVYVCVGRYTFGKRCTQVDTATHANTHSCVLSFILRACLYIFVCVYRYIYIYIYIYMYTCVCIRTHIRI